MYVRTYVCMYKPTYVHMYVGFLKYVQCTIYVLHSAVLLSATMQVLTELKCIQYTYIVWMY